MNLRAVVIALVLIYPMAVGWPCRASALGRNRETNCKVRRARNSESVAGIAADVSAEQNLGPPRMIVTVRSCRYRVLRQSGKHRRTASRSGPGALPAQGHKPVLAVDDARLRLARSHVHTGFTERLRMIRRRGGCGYSELSGGKYGGTSKGFKVVKSI